MVKARLFKNIASLGIIQLVNYVFPLITVPYVSRIIGPDGYGLINYATAFIAYFALLISYGFDLTATRKITLHSKEKENIDNIVSEVLTSRLILFVISVFLFIISIYFFNPIQKDIYVPVILFIGCIATVISPQYIYQGFQDLQIFAKLNFIRGLVNTIFVFILVKKASDYYWIPTLTTIFFIGINLFLFILAKKKYKINYKLISLDKAYKVILAERMVFFSTVVISLYTSTNVVVLGFFANTREIGYYTTSQNFLNIISSLITIPISMSLYPFIGKGFSVSKEYGISLINRVVPIVFYITFLASISILIFAPWMIRLVYGHKFDNSIPVLQIISFLPFIIGMSNIFGIQIMLNLGLDKLFFKTTFIASVIGILLNIVMSKYYGYIGTAWNCLIVESFVTIIMYLALKREKIKIFVLDYFAPQEIIRTIKNRK